VTGKHQYTTDLRLPGMLHGKVLRPAAFGATLASLEAKEAEGVPGVNVVRDGDFVGVTAPTEHVAARPSPPFVPSGKLRRRFPTANYSSI
jgi:Aerobic-type carbon monoxide dehydrogenase, large subunit CoxL/CutL homologs